MTFITFIIFLTDAEMQHSLLNHYEPAEDSSAQANKINVTAQHDEDLLLFTHKRRMYWQQNCQGKLERKNILTL